MSEAEKDPALVLPDAVGILRRKMRTLVDARDALMAAPDERVHPLIRKAQLDAANALIARLQGAIDTSVP